MSNDDFLEKIKYILNFDENKLFNTELDDRYTNKEAYKEDIRKAKEKLKKYLSNTSPMNTARAFNLNKMFSTNTPHQAIANFIVCALKPENIERILFVDFLIDRLKEIEEETK